MMKRPLMTNVDGGRPPAPRWGIVLQSIVILVYVANIVISALTDTLQWYTWLLLVGAAFLTFAVIYDVRRARQCGRRW